MDGRSAEARLLRRVRAELIKHVGGNPSATQLQLIDRAAWLRLHLTKLDARALTEDGLSESAARRYLAFSNALERVSRHIGLQGVSSDKVETLEDILAEHRQRVVA